MPFYKTIFVESTDNIQLELLFSTGKNKIQHRNLPPLLFIHGSYHAAWCWENFLGWFSGRSFDCFAMSLRGHGNSTKIESKASTWTLEQYVEDVSSAVEFIYTNTLMKPIIIGHEMGGAICQKYLETSSNKITSCVLLCSIPPTGSIHSLPYRFSNNPLATLFALLLQNPCLLISTPERAQKMFFSSNIPKDLLIRYHSKLEQTVNTKVNLQTLTTFIDIKKIMNQNDLLKSLIIIGGERDRIIPIDVVETSGKKYGVKVNIVRDVAHDVMLEVKWEDAATVILKRIQEKLFEQSANILM